MVFLITDTDLIKDSFLEDINSILNSGEVPDLFDKEELDGIFVELKAAALEAGVADNPQSLLAFFLQRARCKLHVVLALSPTGQTFRERCRLNPSLVNCCTIDWYDEWPEEALLDVATGHITQPDLVQGSTDLQNNIAKLCVEIHKSASRKVAQFTGETRRHFYITPQNYLGFIDTFTHILRAKKEHIMTERDRFFTGLSKLLEASSSIEVMQEELVALGPQMEQKSKEVEVLMVKLQKDSVVVEQVRAIVKQEEEVMAEETKIVEKYAENAFQELSDVLPALQQAVAALDSLEKSDISEVRVYTHPPFLVLTVMNAVCVLLQKKPDWATAKLLLGDPGFLKRLVTLDKDSIPDKVFVKLRQYSQTPEFNSKVVGSVSNACRSLCQWVLALEHYHQVRKTVEPKEKRLVEAKEALRLAKERLKQKQKALFAVEEHQRSLQKQYSESVAEKQLLAHRKKLTGERLKTAAVLITALDGEKVRWKDSVDRLDLRLEGILGNVLASAAFIVYCGVFPSDYRAQLVGEWLTLCKTYKIPVSDDFSIVRAMASKNEVRRWQNEGLPPDPYSTENAILVKNGQRWPLLIDPHGQAHKWICQLEGDQLQKVQVSDPGYLKIVENAIRLGEPILLLDVAEDLDPSLKPVLEKQIYRRAGQDFIKMGDSEIEYNHSFRLYMTTTMPNPRFLPAVCIMVTMINFTVTFQGLQDQLLSMVVKHKQPHLEERRSQLMESITADLYMLHELEEKSLTLLQKTEGHLLDDRDLIETLKMSKETSRDVFQRIEASEKTEATIEDARKVYLPIATRGAVLYFVVADLVHLNYMYQFSLLWFHQVFMESLGTEEVIQPQISSFGVVRPSSRERSIKTPRSEHEDLHGHIRSIINVLTENVYKIVSSGLFTEHQLCFSFMLSTNIMRHANSSERSLGERDLLPNAEWDFFLHSMLLANMMDKTASLQKTDTREELDNSAVADGSEQSQEIRDDAPKPCTPEWLAQSAWKQCQYMSANMEDFLSLCGSLSSNTRQWKAFSEASTPYQYLSTPYGSQQELTLPAEDTPCTARDVFPWEKLSAFQKLIMIKVLRPECLISSIQEFIVENMGAQYLQSGRMNLKQVFERSAASMPLIFILSPGTDPVRQLERLALETRGGTAHVDMISLGRGQGTKAEELISKAKHLKGRWVFLQNCHLAASFMPKLQEIVDKLSHQGDYIDPQFRLWLSSKPDVAFPVPILQKGFKMAVEPPQGLKGKLLQTFDSSGSGAVTEEVFEKEDGGQSWKKLVFSLCFFNAVVNERKKYGSLGWNIPYQFTSSDLEVSIQMLGMIMRGQAEIPWQAVHYLTGEVVYGGRVTDSWDRRCLLSILDNFYNPAVLCENHAFSADMVYRSLSDSATLQDYRDYLSSLPDTDSPEIFGMHQNAERAHLESQAQLFLDTIVSMQSIKSVEDTAERAEQNKDEIVLEIISDILNVLPVTVESKTKQEVPVTADGTSVSLGSLFSAPAWDSIAKSTKGYDPLINSALLTVLRQEIDRFNHLLSVMHASLHSLKQSIRGEILLNKGLEEVYIALLNLKVPRLWQQSSYESCKSLGSWVDDLVQRLDFFSTWAKQVIKCIQDRFGQTLGFQKTFKYHRPGTSQTAEIHEITPPLLQEQPSSYWLSAFFFPQGFLTAVLQNHARMKGLSVDSLTLKHRVCSAADYSPEANGRQNVQTAAFSESLPPQEGILVFGLFLDGAKWDIENHTLEESEPLHRFYSMPQIHFIPHESGVDSENESGPEEVRYTYECPLYRTPRRAGTLSSTGLSTNYVTAVTLPTHAEAKHWIRRGVALLCQTGD